jgi:ABC-type thiamine transport system ATPase subunit
LKIPNTQKQQAGGVAQGIGSEFKLQHHQKEKHQIEHKSRRDYGFDNRSKRIPKILSGLARQTKLNKIGYCEIG